MDTVDTVYGRLKESALRQARNTYDLGGLRHCIGELEQLSEYLGSDRGLLDSSMRLYCMAATLLCGSSALVPPEDGDLAGLLREMRSDLVEATALLQSCIGLIEPLEHMLGDKA